MATAHQVLATAAAEIGYSRWNDPEAGTKYGRWYAKSHGPYFGTSGVAFCAMGVSWVLDKCGTMLPGGHVAYVPYAINNARKAGKLVSKSYASPGDAVCFDWDGDGLADHIGFVEINRPGSGTMQTIEFNVGNGVVARKLRSYGDVCAVIRPDYNGTPSTSAQDTTTEYQTIPDGYWGKNTSLDMQRAMGTTIDGVVSSQSAYWQSAMPACTTGWEWVSPTYAEGSQLIAAMQRAMGLPADGLAGVDFINALEARFGFTPDGYLSAPSPTIAAMQRALNQGGF